MSTLRHLAFVLTVWLGVAVYCAAVWAFVVWALKIAI